jgi:hypothetical protein
MAHGTFGGSFQEGGTPIRVGPGDSGTTTNRNVGESCTGIVGLIRWANIRDNPPRNLKLSPMTAIPHKRPLFWMILDLSHGVRLRGSQFLSINEATNKRVAPAEVMLELGNVLPQLIYAIAILHAVFPPPAITGHADEDPVSIKRLKQRDGLWATHKHSGVGFLFPSPLDC